jgi:steroid delta-isomerase-like uncharacterized protein
MSAEENKYLVRRMVEQGMIEGDVNAAVAAYASDFIYHNPMLRGMPAAPDMREVVREFRTASRTAFPRMHYTVEAIVAEEDMVAVLYTWRGTHQGSLGGLSPTGREVTATGAFFCRVDGGKIVEQWDIDDRFDVMQQLGLISDLEPATAQTSDPVSRIGASSS